MPNQVKSSQIRSRSGQVMSFKVRLCKIMRRLSQVRSGQVKTCQVRSCQAKSREDEVR